MRTSRTIALVTLGACALGWAGPTAASADVLVESLPSSVSCSAGIRPSVWYQSYSGGSRKATIRIKNTRGVTVYSRNVTASSKGFVYYPYKGRCGSRYTVTYFVPGGSASYKVRIRD